jgi:hypothetical protein
MTSDDIGRLKTAIAHLKRAQVAANEKFKREAPAEDLFTLGKLLGAEGLAVLLLCLSMGKKLRDEDIAEMASIAREAQATSGSMKVLLVEIVKAWVENAKTD